MKKDDVKKIDETKKGVESEKSVDDDFEEEELIKEPGSGMEMWKPEKEGEKVVGKLLAISQTRFNKILRISTELDGVISVPISTFLEDVDFDRLVGEKISIQYTGKAGRNCRLFKVSHFKAKF